MGVEVLRGRTSGHPLCLQDIFEILGAPFLQNRQSSAYQHVMRPYRSGHPVPLEGQFLRLS